MKRLLVILFSTALLASCGGENTTTKDAANLAKLKADRAKLDDQIKKIEAAHPDTSVKPISVKVMEVQSQPFRAFVDVQAQIAGDENVNVLPQMAGVVTRVNVSPGQRVGQGQVLAMLDAAAVDQQIKAQDAQLSFAKTVYEKQQRLWAQNIGTEIQLLQAKSNCEAYQKQREATVAQRNMYRIVSPISGVVDQVSIKVGDIASPASPTGGIRVVNNNKLKAEANLGESYLGKVKAGDNVTLVFNDNNDSIQTKLTYVAQAIDPVSRAFMVQVRLGSNNKLHPNMSAKMKINNYTNNDVIIAPVTAIQALSDGDVVYVAEGNKARRVIVKQGRNSNGMVEILSGLNTGDKIVTEGMEDLEDGKALQVQ